MDDRTPDATPTVDLGPGGRDEPRRDEPRSAFDPRAERFSAVGELGRGGMGRVDDAIDRALGRPVAIKHMLSTSELALARFEREARITARLEHPGIVPIHDVGRGPDGTPYYIMRRVDGQPLDAELGQSLAARLARLPNVLAACDAVAFAHARGIIHRDIKPTNILVGPFGETLVIDWGLAREIDEVDGDGSIAPSDPQLTRVGTVAGTPGFMAPEQARGEAVDARADVFALGATLFYVLSGKLPYETESATEMVGLAGAGRPPNWSALPRDVPADLRAITVKAMASEADARYPDAGALAADLRQFITGNLVAAYDYGPLARFVRFVRRHRGAVAVAGVSALVLIAVVVLAFRRIVAERDDATHARAVAETQRREASSMADRLLVQHALSLAETDPLATIAALRTLSPESEHWGDARIAAAAAFVHGIPFGFLAGPNVVYVQISRDNRHAIVATRSGRLSLIDLIARTDRQLRSAGVDPHGVSWLGGSLVIGFPDHVAILDVTTGAIRSLPISARHVRGDHGTRVWIETMDDRLLELDDVAGTPHELGRGIANAWPSRDYSRAIVQRGSSVELWTATAHVHLVDLPKDRFIGDLDDHHVVLFAGSTLWMYTVDGDHVVADGTIEGPTFLGAYIVGGKYYVITVDGTYVIWNHQLVRTSISRGMFFPTPQGAIHVGDSGDVTIVDDRGQFTLGRRDAGLRRADASLDGRFILGTTASGTAVVWDLRTLYPRRYPDPGKQFARISGHNLWLWSAGGGLARIDLATGKEHTLPSVVSSGMFEVDPLDRWAMIPIVDRIGIYDLVHHLEQDIRAHAAALADDGIVLLRDDGSVWRWQPGAELREVAHVRADPTGTISAGRNVIAVVYADRVVRIDLVTHGQHTAPIAGVEDHGFAVEGTLWMRTHEGVVWRWPSGGDPARLDLAQPPTKIALGGNDALFYTHEAITLQRGTTRRVVAIASTGFAWDGGSTVATINAEGVVRILDMDTGLGYPLPMTDGDRVAIHDHYVAIGTQNEVQVWNVDIPKDPRALRAWLSTITNAKTIPGSEAYAWP